MRKHKPSQQRSHQSFPSGEKGHVAETPAVPYGSARDHWIAASDFKAQCLELMDRVRDQHEPFVITKYGVPIAKLVPFEGQAVDIVGFMRGTVLAYGDLVSPIDEVWDAST
jgi:prevent-host-death family protein